MVIPGMRMFGRKSRFLTRQGFNLMILPCPTESSEIPSTDVPVGVEMHGVCLVFFLRGYCRAILILGLV